MKYYDKDLMVTELMGLLVIQ